jgi:hypothetical protein
MKTRWMVLILALLAGLVVPACTSVEEKQGKSCCDCLIESGCWDYGSDYSCPSSDCYCVYASSYGSNCKPDGENCVGYYTACYEQNCQEECSGVQGF